MFKSLELVILIFMVIPLSYGLEQDHAPHETRAEKGTEVLGRILGNDQKSILKKLEDLSPEMTRWVVGFAYGEVVSRTQLALRTRELATVAALTAMGTAEPQLKTHIGMALNAGTTASEIRETIMQITVYADFPAGLNGIRVVRDVFKEKEIKES